MNLNQENPGVCVALWSSGRHRAGGEGSWTSITQRQDIPPSQSQDAWVSVPSSPWLTLGSHLQRLSIFTNWRRSRKAFSFLCVSMLSHVWLFVTPWTIACQAPLSMGFSKQEYCSGLPCPPPGNLPNPEIKPYQDTRHPLVSSALAGGVCIIALPGKPIYV